MENIEREIFWIEENAKIITGEVENRNNLSEDEVRDFIKGQFEALETKLNKLKRESCNDRLIAKMEKKVENCIEMYCNI